MSSTHKLYPRNNLYTTGQSHISNNISNNTHNNIKNTAENQSLIDRTHNKGILQIEQLYLRIQRLQSEMSSVMEDVEATFGLQDNSQLNIENEELKQTLIKNQQITKYLKQKISQLQSQNGQLRANMQTQQLQIQKQKSANKALSQQIVNYKSNREMVEKQSIEKTAQLEQLAKMVLKYEKQVECLTEEIQLFKSEIEQNSIISNQKISLYQQEISIQRQQIQQLTNNSQPSQEHKEVVKLIENENLEATNEVDNNILINLKNAKIKSLQSNINYMQEQIRGKQKQLANMKNMNMKSQKQANTNQHFKQDQQRNQKLYEEQLKQMENKITHKSAVHKEQLRQIERKYEQKINSLQSQLTSCKRFQSQIKVIEQSNKCLKQEATIHELQIYELEQKIRNLKRKQDKLKGIQDQVEEMKRYEQEQQKRYSSAQKNKYKITQELQQLRNSYSHVQKQLQATQRHKQNVILELQHLTQQYHQLKQQQNEYRQQQLQNIKLEQEKQSKWEQTSSRLQNSLKQIETVQQINKQLESILENQKVMKQSQINKYKSILNDYKTLNQELTKELAQYRNNQPIDQFLNFQKDQLPIKNLPQFSDHSQNQPKFSTNKPTLVSSNQSKMGKQEQFTMVQNTSLRSQIVELSIRIQEYRGTIDALEERLKRNNVESMRIALQKEYEGKMDIQRMEIINEYNILLRQRQVRVQHKDSPCTHGHFEQNIKHHPQYKALQQEYLNLQKEILEIEHKTYKTNTQYKDEIQKLRIQNEFHRKNIDHLHSQSYKITPNYQHQFYPSDNRATRLNQEISITQPSKQPFSFAHYNSHTSNENVELQNLRKVVDHAIYLLGLTSSSPSSTINKSIWIIQEMEELVKLLRQDLQIIKTQKKQTTIKNKALNLQIQLLEEENRNLSRQLSMSREKQKYLQNKSLKLSIQSQVGLKNQLKTDKIRMQNQPDTVKYHKMNEVHQAQWVTHNLNYDSLPNR